MINDIAYICCGQNNRTYMDDLWKFDPQTGAWTQHRDTVMPFPSEKSAKEIGTLNWLS